VYQPWGVGLIHTQPKPSAAHYTHAGVGGRKF